VIAVADHPEDKLNPISMEINSVEIFPNSYRCAGTFDARALDETIFGGDEPSPLPQAEVGACRNRGELMRSAQSQSPACGHATAARRKILEAVTVAIITGAGALDRRGAVA
jgi:hypothetical protein